MIITVPDVSFIVSLAVVLIAVDSFVTLYRLTTNIAAA